MTTPPPTAAGHGTADTGGKASGAGRLRSYLAIDTREPFIAYAQTARGRLLMLLTAMIAVAPHLGVWMAALAASGAMAAVVWPARRVPILLAATWVSAFLSIGWEDVDTQENIRLVLRQEGMTNEYAVVLAVGLLSVLLIVIAGMLYWTQRAPHSLLSRRPLIVLLAVETLLCGIGSFGLLHGGARVMLWSLIFVITPYLWFLPFAIMDLRSRAPSSVLMQISVLRPFWSPTYLPFGKGAAFLRKHLSPTPRELAVTQLKAIKLFIWANMLLALRWMLGWLVEDQAHIPDVQDAMDAFLAGSAYPLAAGWAAMIWSTAKYTLKIAMWAHVFIGVARLAGYRLPRGMWRPLGSRTLMDYFNRFHYYFKELLVDLFFMPTFFTVFRRHPRLRMFFATFMAAGVGNALWHFTRDIHIVAQSGPAYALESYTSYLFYCTVLATGVGLSQVRANLGFRPSATPAGRLYSFLLVWSFVVCLHIFGDGSRDHTLNERIKFLASLFTVSL